MTYPKIKILFIGTVDFSYEALKFLIENKFQIVGLVTKKFSNFNSDYKDLSILASMNNIPIIYKSKDNNKEIFNFVKDKFPDVIYCFGWSHILSPKMLSLPKYGVIGFHPAELPNNRGRHPIIWALFLNLKQTASTFFLMNEGTDTGDIISQEIVEISNLDNASSLYKKITKVALSQILSFTNDLEKKSGNIKKIKQSLKKGNYWRKRNKNDGKIDFRMSSIAIYNLIRALTKPYIGAHIYYNNKEIKIWDVKVEKCSLANYEPGRVLEIEFNDIIVKTYDGAIRIFDHDFTNLPLKGEYL